MTDFKKLCAELVREWDAANGDHDLLGVADVMDRVRAALALSDPSVDSEVAELVAWLRSLEDASVWFEEGTTEAMKLSRAAELLERLAEPGPVGPSVEELAQLIYERAMAPAAFHCKMEVQPWASRGNSIAQDDARDCARAVLQKWGPTITP